MLVVYALSWGGAKVWSQAEGSEGLRKPEEVPTKLGKSYMGGPLRGGRVLLTEMLLPRIARQGTVCRKTQIEKYKLDEGLQQYDLPFRNPQWTTQLVGLAV